MKRSDAIALATLSAILTLLFVDVLAGVNVLYLRDIAHYYYPVKHVLREIVLGGEFPYWNPLMAAGQPLAANPEHEVFYPLTWLILLPSYDLGFRLLMLVHLHIAAWTMYALLRSMRISIGAAFLSALSFALGGVVLSSLVLLPILFALAWLPLTVLCLRRYLREHTRRDFALAALSLGLQMLVGEPTTIAQTGFLLGMYALSTRDWRNIVRVAMISVVALLAGAATILPAIDHAGDSVRARGFDYDVVTAWSTPAARIAELAWPHAIDVASRYDRRTPFYLSIYPGLLITLLVLAGFATRTRGAALTASILAVSWLLALGAHTPLWRWLYDAGLARSVRYPEKFLLLGAFASIVFAARVLDRFVDGDRRKLALLTLVVLADLGRTLPDVAPRMPAEYLTEPPRLAQRLPNDRDAWRLMNVVEWQNRDAAFRPFTTGPDLYWMRRNALRPAMPARWNIRTVMELDFDLTALQPTTDFTDTAFWLAHGRPDWPAIIGPMANARFLGAYDDPRAAFARARTPEDVQPLRVVPLGDNPRYFFATRVETIRDLRDFAGRLAAAQSTRGVAYVQQQLPPMQTGVVRKVHETANTARIDVTTAGPAFLVISVTPHKYWTLAVDGRETNAIVTNAGFQGVVVPAAGDHVVEMRYRNPLVAAGAAISAATLLALAFVAITMRAL